MTTLGIDTSNYTTSAATYDGAGYLMTRRILDVKKGRRGIRQSEGVFIHNRELPGILEQRLAAVGGAIDAVGVSVRPRNAEGSYMPVFTVGHGYARTVAAAAGVPLYEFSHQDGHIMAGLYSANKPDFLNAPFISVHLSGGTTEILKSEYNGVGFDNELIGGTLDINAGQLIDRVGVALGLKFPCGKELEKLAQKTDTARNFPVFVKGAYMNLSGLETKLLREIESGAIDGAAAARTVLCRIADALIKTIRTAADETGTARVLVVGGVASNEIIRDMLCAALDFETVFSTKELASDNAVGTAVLAAKAARM